MKSLFKKKSTVVEQSETKIEESQLDFPIDRADYFFDHALVFYCEENDIPSEKLSNMIFWIPKAMDLTLKMYKNSRMKRLRVQTISLNILMKNSIQLISVTHSFPSSLIFMKITWISVIQSWLMMLLELNLTGKSITWLKMILTRCLVNIRLTSDNKKNASLNREKHFLMSKILLLICRPIVLAKFFTMENLYRCSPW